jgi:hypothetical protein
MASCIGLFFFTAHSRRSDSTSKGFPSIIVVVLVSSLERRITCAIVFDRKVMISSLSTSFLLFLSTREKNLAPIRIECERRRGNSFRLVHWTFFSFSFSLRIIRQRERREKKKRSSQHDRDFSMHAACVSLSIICSHSGNEQRKQNNQVQSSSLPMNRNKIDD